MPMTDGGTDPDSANSPSDGTFDDAVAPAAVTKPEIPFGEWPSPISAADVARSGLRLSFPAVVGGDVWWQEVRPDEGGRSVVICRAAGGQQIDLLPAPWNARSRVHEYGGQSYLPVPRPAGPDGQQPRGRAIVFANYADQRL